MRDPHLLHIIDSYLRNELSPEDKAAFEKMLQEDSSLDHMVVEQKVFIQRLEAQEARKNFEATVKEISNQIPTPQASEGKVIQLWRKHKKVISIAASIAGITALLISAAVNSFTERPTSEIKQLSQALNEVKRSQQITNIEIEDLKKASTTPVANAKLGGTGFLIDPKGYIVTSAHTVVKADSVYIQNYKGEYFKVNTIYVNSPADIAILKIEDAKYTPLKSLPYGVAKHSAEVGEDIFTLGYPRPTAEIVYNRGYLSAKTGYLGDSLAYQMAISANPGNSGAPIFNKDGEVIGIMSGKQITAEGVVFSSRSSNIFTALQEIKKDSTLNENIKLHTATTVKGLDRVQQIKKFEPYMFMVKSY